MADRNRTAKPSGADVFTQLAGGLKDAFDSLPASLPPSERTALLEACARRAAEDLSALAGMLNGQMARMARAARRTPEDERRLEDLELLAFKLQNENGELASHLEEKSALCARLELEADALRRAGAENEERLSALRAENAALNAALKSELERSRAERGGGAEPPDLTERLASQTRLLEEMRLDRERLLAELARKTEEARQGADELKREGEALAERLQEAERRCAELAERARSMPAPASQEDLKRLSWEQEKSAHQQREIDELHQEVWHLRWQLKEALQINTSLHERNEAFKKRLEPERRRRSDALRLAVRTLEEREASLPEDVRKRVAGPLSVLREIARLARSEETDPLSDEQTLSRLQDAAIALEREMGDIARQIRERLQALLP